MNSGQTEFYSSKPKDLLEELNVDTAEVIAKVLSTNGDMTFEQLDCIGLDPNRDALEGEYLQ